MLYKSQNLDLSKVCGKIFVVLLYFMILYKHCSSTGLSMLLHIIPGKTILTWLLFFLV